MAELIAEAVTAMDIGCRSRQEDAVIADFSRGSDLGIAVLSDGMGGHDDGDLASRIIVSEMFGELLFSAARPHMLQDEAPNTFRDALHVVNRRLQKHVSAGSISQDTGGTLVSLAVSGDELRWISVGDSPLYLYRGKTLHRLNEVHSLAAQIDLMVRCGEMDPEMGRLHPQRHCLTSAITGGDINQIDCPQKALHLLPGDVLVLASDGVNVLPDGRICDLIRRHRFRPAQTMAGAIMSAIQATQTPDQDNVSLVVIKLSASRGRLFGAAGRAVQNGYATLGAVLRSGAHQILSAGRASQRRVRT